MKKNPEANFIFLSLKKQKTKKNYNLKCILYYIWIPYIKMSMDTEYEYCIIYRT